MQQPGLWPVAFEALHALGRHYGPEMERVAGERNLPEWYGWLLPALTFEPEPISVARLRLRSPYTAPRRYEERLARAAEQGYLSPVAGAEGEYRLTTAGREAAYALIKAAYAKMAELQPLPIADLERLAGLLFRLVQSCLVAAGPPGKWCLRHSRRVDPGIEAPVVIRIDQYLSDLAAYRDDAHLAAWQPLAIEGHAWEAFTYLWRGEAATLEELCQKLERRGYSLEEYREALEDLVLRGWLVREGDRYELTALGREVRQQAEETTDRYFYAPWVCLSSQEREELSNLLVRLGKGV